MREPRRYTSVSCAVDGAVAADPLAGAFSVGRGRSTRLARFTKWIDCVDRPESRRWFTHIMNHTCFVWAQCAVVSMGMF